MPKTNPPTQPPVPSASISSPPRNHEREISHAKAIGFARYQAISVSQELNSSEKEIISVYTRNQTLFNNYLKQNISIDSPINRNAKCLDEALIKLHNGTEVVYRGFSCPKGIYGGKIKKGCVVYNNLFMSSSLSRTYASKFATAMQGEGVLLEIYGRSGKNISIHSRFQGVKGEAEYLFRPGTTFEVTELMRNKNGFYIIIKEVFHRKNSIAKNIYTGEDVVFYPVL